MLVLGEGCGSWIWILFLTILGSHWEILGKSFGILDFILKSTGESLEVFEWAQVWYDFCLRKDRSGFFECFERTVGSHDWKHTGLVKRRGCLDCVGPMEAGDMAGFSMYLRV